MVGMGWSGSNDTTRISKFLRVRVRGWRGLKSKRARVTCLILHYKSPVCISSRISVRTSVGTLQGSGGGRDRRDGNEERGERVRRKGREAKGRYFTGWPSMKGNVIILKHLRRTVNGRLAHHPTSPSILPGPLRALRSSFSHSPSRSHADLVLRLNRRALNHTAVRGRGRLSSLYVSGLSASSNQR